MATEVPMNARSLSTTDLNWTIRKLIPQSESRRGKVRLTLVERRSKQLVAIRTLRKTSEAAMGATNFLRTHHK